jgi:glutamate-5-semialdehyde dehydrogenase
MTATQVDLAGACEELARGARQAARQLTRVTGAVRNRALGKIARLVRDQAAAILAANERDLQAAEELGLTKAQIDRLRLSDARLVEMGRAVEEIAELSDPVGQIIEATVRPNGLEVQKVRIPLGVVLLIYESRPNVTTDAAALCIKSGNAVILRGGKEAQHSNRALVGVIRTALADAGVAPDAVNYVDTTDRRAVGILLKLDRDIDVVIPRGGEDLIRRVVAESTIPVLKHYKGVCHVYIDKDADPEMAVTITENAKCQRPGVCNAAETLLVHQAVAPTHLPLIAQRLQLRGTELRGCPKTCALVRGCTPADPHDYYTEYLDLVMSVRVVDDIDEAISHIAQYGSGHTETIVTQNLSAARHFAAAVDSSAVMINASTRFNDGGQFGLGAEIGISTNKLHARGPCGVNELTTYKYVVYGNGQIRM